MKCMSTSGRKGPEEALPCPTTSKISRAEADRSTEILLGSWLNSLPIALSLLSSNTVSLSALHLAHHQEHSLEVGNINLDSKSSQTSNMKDTWGENALLALPVVVDTSMSRAQLVGPKTPPAVVQTSQASRERDNTMRNRKARAQGNRASVPVFSFFAQLRIAGHLPTCAR